MQDSCDQVNYETVCCVFIRSQLHFHGSELDSPSNIIIDGDFQSYWIPVGSVKHFKKCVLFIWHVREVFVHNENVSLHDICDMIDQMFINFDIKLFWQFDDFVSFCLANVKIVIVVFRSVELSIPNVVICTGVTRVRNVSWIFRIALLFWSVINRSGNNVPSHVPIRYFSLHKRSSGCESQKQWA
mgnify:CR=1 FL=1